MKRLFIVLSLLLCLLFLGLNNVDGASAPNGKTAPTVKYTDVATYDSSYYSSVSSKSGDALLEGLASLSKTKHRYFTTYDEIWGGNCYSDADPSNKSSKLLDFYTQKSISNAYSTSTWNREHVWPQSLTNGLYGTEGAGADIHHLRPCIDNINSSRNNKKFGDLGKKGPNYYSFSLDSAAQDKVSSSDTLFGYSQGDVFEPLDKVKGDVARIVMYMYMHYSKDVSANSSFSYAGNLPITNIMACSSASSAFDLLMEWNELDPVDSFEVNRNNYCASVTGLRNPFVDHPEFANKIWDASYSDDNSSDSETTTPVDYQGLLTSYYNNGVYTKKTNINLNSNAKSDLAVYFHGDVALDRTTYYNGNYLLMSDIDGGFGTINSGYRNDGSDMKHFTYQNGSVVDDYTVENTNINTFYVSLYKMKSSTYLDSTWTNGVHNVTTKTDKYLADFLAFTAPCLTDYVLSSNFITANGMKLKIEELSNSIGDYLSLKMYVSNDNSGLVGSDLVLSEARIYKGNSSFNDSNLTPSNPDDSGNSGESTTPSTPEVEEPVITPVKTTYSYTFTSKVYSSESTQTLGDKNWRVSGTDNAYFGYSSTKGHQFGSANNPFTSLNITVTTDFTNISSIYITTSGANGTTAKLKIYVGDTLYGERTLTSEGNTFMVTPGGVTGRVSFKFTQSTSAGKAKAIYVKQIKVGYTAYTSTTSLSSINALDNTKTRQMAYIPTIKIEEAVCDVTKNTKKNNIKNIL